MKTSDLVGIIKLLNIPNVQYINGVTQRYFEWNKKNIEEYLGGIKYINLKKERPYLINSMVTKKIKSDSHFDIISLTDGQQRTTTTYLHICAICAYMKKNNLTIGEYDYNAIKDIYLINPYATGDNRYKLLLREKDRETLKMIVEELPEGGLSTNLGRNKIINAYNQLYNSLNEYNIDETFNKLFLMVIVNIIAEKDDDEYIIFNMINSGGRKAGLFTLCKAHAIGKFDIKTQELYDKLYWETIENNETYKSTIISTYILYNLGMMSGDYYYHFKDLFARFDSHDEFHKDLKSYSSTFLKILHNDFEDKEIKELMEGISLILRPSRYMIPIKLLRLYESDKLSKDELMDCLNLILNVGIRKYIESKKAWESETRNMFESNINWLNEKTPYESILEKLQPFFISNTKFNMILCSKNFYKNKKDELLPSNINKITKYLLLRVENYHFGEGRINGAHFNIEHCCPQHLTEEWKQYFTDEEHLDHVHNLGNLTLLAKEHNSAVQDYNFQKKKEVYEFDKLYLGRGLCSYTDWNSKNIQHRTHILADELCKIFKIPSNRSLKDYFKNQKVQMEGK